jgi:hypothetical protein
LGPDPNAQTARRAPTLEVLNTMADQTVPCTLEDAKTTLAALEKAIQAVTLAKAGVSSWGMQDLLREVEDVLCTAIEETKVDIEELEPS